MQMISLRFFLVAAKKKEEKNQSTSAPEGGFRLHIAFKGIHFKWIC